MRLHGRRFSLEKGSKTVTVTIWSDESKTLSITDRNGTKSVDLTASEWTSLYMSAWDANEELKKEFGHDREEERI